MLFVEDYNMNNDLLIRIAFCLNLRNVLKTGKYNGFMNLNVGVMLKFDKYI